MEIAYRILLFLVVLILFTGVFHGWYVLLKGSSDLLDTFGSKKKIIDRLTGKTKPPEKAPGSKHPLLIMFLYFLAATIVFLVGSGIITLLALFSSPMH